MERPTSPPSPEFEALAKLPVLLEDAEASLRYGEGSQEGHEYRQAVISLSEQAEDSLSEIESSFEVPLHQNEDDLEVLDLLIESGWAQQMPSEEELAAIALSWGAYLGEIVLKTLGGNWVVRAEPEHASIRFPRLGLQFFPAHAILRRFALGEAANLATAYQDLVEALVKE